MESGFDAYYLWLGIAPDEQPPNHYRLLGIRDLEANPDVIEAAADRQAAHIRTYQTGKHARESQQLLNEISAARICLLNEEKKAEYDRQLKSTAAAGPSGQVPTRPQPLEKDALPMQPVPMKPPEEKPAAAVLPPAPAPVSPEVKIASGGASPWDDLADVQQEAGASPPAVNPVLAGGPAAWSSKPGKKETINNKPLIIMASVGGVVIVLVIVLVAVLFRGGDKDNAAQAGKDDPVVKNSDPSSSANSSTTTAAAAKTKALEKILAADGMVADRFAICQTMPLKEFEQVAEDLRSAYYRPVRLRPYPYRGIILVAALWRRDKISWKLKIGVSAGDIERADRAFQSEGMLPVDAAGYIDGASEKYAALWEESPTKKTRVLLVGLTPENKQALTKPFFDDKYLVRINQAFTDADGVRKNCHIWEKPTERPGFFYFGGTAGYLNKQLDDKKKNAFMIDLAVTRTIGKSGNPHALYTGSMLFNDLWKSETVHSISPADHIDLCGNLVGRGYYPVSISVASIEDGKPLVAASIWHATDAEVLGTPSKPPGVGSDGGGR